MGFPAVTAAIGAYIGLWKARTAGMQLTQLQITLRHNKSNLEFTYCKFLLVLCCVRTPKHKDGQNSERES